MARHHGMWSSITTEILAEMRARSAQEPGAEQPCFRRTSSGHTARCIEGPGDLRVVHPNAWRRQRLWSLRCPPLPPAHCACPLLWGLP
jgi:hypothetical protein